jgi:hypothetical protein
MPIGIAMAREMKRAAKVSSIVAGRWSAMMESAGFL